jgi:hypothetical protein
MFVWPLACKERQSVAAVELALEEKELNAWTTGTSSWPWLYQPSSSRLAARRSARSQLLKNGEALPSSQGKNIIIIKSNYGSAGRITFTQSMER